MAKVEKDFEELLRLFNKHKVRYCIIGAFAVGFYARPRYTKDLDIIVEPSLKNGEKIIAALKDFGFSSLDLTPKDFSIKGRFIQLGYEPIRIDLTTAIEGLSFTAIWKNRKKGVLGKTKVNFIGLAELIRNKKKSKRKQDLADLEILKPPSAKK
jgi:hypothetical protein